MGRGDYSVPLVEGTRPAWRGSMAMASRSARARPLKQVSAMWWLLSPYSVLDVQRDAGVLREGLEPLAEQLGVHLADLRAARRRPSRSGTAGPRRRRRRGSASRPSAGAGRRSGRCPACRPAPWPPPGPARCRSPRWCGGNRCAGRPWPSSVMSISEWRASCSSMWSRKPMPVDDVVGAGAVEIDGRLDLGLLGGAIDGGLPLHGMLPCLPARAQGFISLERDQLP